MSFNVSRYQLLIAGDLVKNMIICPDGNGYQEYLVKILHMIYLNFFENKLMTLVVSRSKVVLDL